MAPRENLGPTVVDGRVRYTSASALQKLRGCNRAWYFRYVLRLPDKAPGRGVMLGMQGHARWENYLRTGDARPLVGSDRVALERGWVPALPLPRDTCQAEVGIHHVEGEALVSPLKVGDVPVVGYVDVVDTAGDTPLVLDWKYKGDLDKYAASPGELADPRTDSGLQVIGYAAALFGAAPTRVRHVSMAHSGRPDARLEEALLPAGSAIIKWASVAAELAEPLAATARAARWQDVPCNREMCGRYGGCAWRMRCEDVVALLIGGKSMGILTTPATPAATPAVPELAKKKLFDLTPPDAPKLPPAASAVPGQHYTVAGVVYRCEGKAGDQMLFHSLTLALDAPGGVVRKPLTDPCPPVATGPAPTTATPPPATAEATVAALTASIASVSPPVPGATLTLPPPIPEPAKRGRGRPAGAKNKPKDLEDRLDAALAEGDAEAVKVTAEAVAAIPTEVKAAALASNERMPLETVPDGLPQGHYLYFGCSPLGVPVLTLHAYVNELDARIRKALNVSSSDIRLATTQELDYSKWKAVLGRLAAENPPPPGHYLASGFGDERVDVAAQALVPTARLVVR